MAELRSWKIWKWDDENAGVTGPAISPDDDELTGMDWVRASEETVVSVADLRAAGETTRRWKCPIHGLSSKGDRCTVPDDPSADESPRCLRRCEAVEYVTIPLAVLEAL